MAAHANIDVLRLSDTDCLTFFVTVAEGDSQSQHHVTVSPGWAARFTQEPERVVDAAFRFLLDRESKESILSRFDISDISRYFPEFPREIAHYLAQL